LGTEIRNPKSEIPNDEQRAYYNRIWTQSSWLARLWPRVAWPDDRCRFRVVMRLVRGLRLPASPRILEVGCGLGRLAARLRRLGETTALDLSDAAIEQCRRTIPGVAFLAGDFLALELPSGHFDVVVSSEVIEHFPYGRQPEFAAKTARLLRPGGRLVLTTPNASVMPPPPPEMVQPVEDWLDASRLRKLLEAELTVERLGSLRWASRNRWLDRLWQLCYPINPVVVDWLFGSTLSGVYLWAVARKS
jgi:2-polyprenyl-3-methyl-5-hydroxy-6-metoxy-1,4-benzoquinol methylase